MEDDFVEQNNYEEADEVDYDRDERSKEADSNTKDVQDHTAEHQYEAAKSSGTSDAEIIKQIQQVNHNQLNEIAQLKKDVEYWKQKSVKLTIDFHSAVYDNQKSEKAASNLKENQELKANLAQLEQSLHDKEEELTALNSKYDELKKDHEALVEKHSNPPVQDQATIEKEIIAKAASVEDINALMRIVFTLNTQCQQKYFSQAMNSSKGQGGLNGVAGGEPQNPQMMYMPSVPYMNSMNFMPMAAPYDGSSQTAASKQNTSAK